MDTTLILQLPREEPLRVSVQTYLSGRHHQERLHEAHHEGRKQEIWDWFTDTMLSRLETGGKIIIIMTRWATDDMAGRALEDLPKAGYKVRHINFKAVQDDGSMLCEEVLSRADFDKKKRPWERTSWKLTTIRTQLT